MKAKEWRMRVECLIADIEAVLSYRPKMTMDKDGCPDDLISDYAEAKTELALAEAKLRLIEDYINRFKERNINRETCDDFDE